MEARKARHRRGVFAVAILIAAIAVLVPTLAFGHIERASYWPDPAPDSSVKPAAGGSVPAVRKLFSALDKKNPGKTRVVCAKVPSKKQRKHGSDKKLSKNKSMKALNKDIKKARKKGYKLRESQPAIKLKKKEAKKLRKFNLKLLRQCRYKSIQDAVTASHNNDRVEIMPGLYTEPKSRAKPTNDPACDQYEITNDKNQAGAVSYAYQFHCPNDQNLIAVIGRCLTNVPVPQPPRLDRHVIPDAGACIRCNMQIQGTGASPDAVTIDAGNTASGDGAPIGAVKDVGIRADRADGFVLDNVKVRHAQRARHLCDRDRRLTPQPLQGPLRGRLRPAHLRRRSLADRELRWLGRRRLGALSRRERRPRRGGAARSAALRHRAPQLRHAPQCPRLLGHRRQRGVGPQQRHL